MEAILISTSELTKMLWLAVLAFVIAVVWTPLFTNFLYKHNLGKKIRDSKSAPIMSALHAKKAGTPTMAGILVWVTAAVLTLTFNLERQATWLPLFCLIATGIVGAVDDLWNVRGKGPNGGGMRFRDKFLIYAVIAALGAWWFYFKLDWNSIHIPAIGDYVIGWWYIPIFIVTLIWMAFSSNETDGLDGLAGGIFAFSYGAFAVIALTMGKFELAAFCTTIMGALLAFLWFNIPPARFFMGDTGSMALGMTLGVIAFLTNSVVALFIVTLVFSIEGLSFIIQFVSKKLRGGKKVFLSSPLHHHLEAIGWPEYKITMRFWVIGTISAVAGLMIALLGRGF
ncbi:phospho-N-acetylmuramoyl-pentapeptide-transferase [candidate division WWE3 bacterium RIFOXYC2_FULL_40_11]|nr:MAG: phospho-N-acetylmuramoyl-pentapeptide-transferase [candidate division WWE3 bacterium RIFOXYC2_FULL_40_11]